LTAKADISSGSRGKSGSESEFFALELIFGEYFMAVVVVVVVDVAVVVAACVDFVVSWH